MSLDDKPTIDDSVALDLLFVYCDEGPGLYEAMMAIHGRFPESTLLEKYRAASRAIRRLHEMGLIEFYREVSYPNGRVEYETLGLSADEVLEQPHYWYPACGSGRYGYTITPKGERTTLEPGAV